VSIFGKKILKIFAAAIIKGNHTNCAQFANASRLNWLFGRLGSQASGEGGGSGSGGAGESKQKKVS